MRSTGYSPNTRFSIASRLRHTYPVPGFTRAVIVCPTPDATHGTAGNLQRPQYQQETPTAPNLPLSASKATNHSGEPRLEQRYHLHPSSAWLPLSCGHNGLGNTQGAVMAVIKHSGCQFPCRGFERSHRQIRQTRNHEYRSGFSVHWFGMDNHSH